MELPVLEKNALLLPEAQRALLADRLLASLAPEPDALQVRWLAEAESRLKAYQSGSVPAVDGPHTMASLKAKFRP